MGISLYTEDQVHRMFNTVQLNRLSVEPRALAESGSAAGGDARAVAEPAESVVRNRGYLWLSGD